MPKKVGPYNKNKSVKAIARKRVGSPPAARLLDEKPARAKSKHKKSLLEED
jgi:hypothetical protein